MSADGCWKIGICSFFQRNNLNVSPERSSAVASSCFSELEKVLCKNVASLNLLSGLSQLFYISNWLNCSQTLFIFHVSLCLFWSNTLHTDGYFVCVCLFVCVCERDSVMERDDSQALQCHGASSHGGQIQSETIIPLYFCSVMLRNVI